MISRRQINTPATMSANTAIADMTIAITAAPDNPEEPELPPDFPPELIVTVAVAVAVVGVDPE